MSVQYATFEVADQLFGVTVDSVQEVLTFKLEGRLMLALDPTQAVDTYRAMHVAMDK